MYLTGYNIILFYLKDCIQVIIVFSSKLLHIWYLSLDHFVIDGLHAQTLQIVNRVKPSDKRRNANNYTYILTWLTTNNQYLQKKRLLWINNANNTL